VISVITVIVPENLPRPGTTGTTSPIPSTLEATVSVSPAAALPEDATPLRLTGNTTGTGDNTGLILVSAFGIAAVPGDYDVLSSLTDFPSVSSLVLHVHAVNVLMPPSLGLFTNHFFAHMHLCLLFTFHSSKQSGSLSCTKVATMTCLHPFQRLIESAQCKWMHG